MKEKLPKIYANKIEKEIKNNEKIYTSTKKNNEPQKEKTQESKTTIKTKINKIFNTKKYIYKIPVRIKMKETDNEIITKIIGKNKKHIITIDGNLIEIEQIKDIEIKEE